MILQNAVMVKSTKEIYVSSSVHDFVSFTTSDGTERFIDGGKEYFRHSCTGEDVELLFLTDKNTIEELVEKTLWGRSTGEWVFLKDCDSDHLKNILRYGENSLGFRYNVINEILKNRGVV